MKLVNTSLLRPNMTVGVALSGGKDSISLTHYLKENAEKLNIKVLAINVEHGIRGENSILDTEFVKDFCAKFSIPLLTYSVDAPFYAKTHSLSIEHSARILRYDCFLNAIAEKKCDVVATAHHKGDNLESVLFNLFRGTGIKGLSGIKDRREDGIIRPLLAVSKAEIDEYIDKNNLPFVTDETNADDEYTRNALRHLVVPEIKKIFPDAESAVLRLAQIVKKEDEFLDDLAKSYVVIQDDKAKISLSTPDALMPRAVIFALKSLGVTRDWAKSHVDGVIELKNLSNGNQISLLNNFVAFKEYDTIVITRHVAVEKETFPLFFGRREVLGQSLCIEKVEFPKDLKTGFYGDLDKIPNDAIIRTRRDGDKFTKFGGGTKNLGDYFTDVKVPLRLRDSVLLLASGNEVLVVFGIAVSNKIKVDKSTKNIIKFTSEK